MNIQQPTQSRLAPGYISNTKNLKSDNVSKQKSSLQKQFNHPDGSRKTTNLSTPNNLFANNNVIKADAVDKLDFVRMPEWEVKKRQNYFAKGIVLPVEVKGISSEVEARIKSIPNSPVAMMKRYIEIEKSLPVKRECKSRLIEVPNAKGTVILLHGFSAGSWQYDEWQKQYAEKGYNVFIPRLVGHGLVDAYSDEDDLTKLPKADKTHEWALFCDQVHAMAAEADLPVHVAGISGGGTCAAYLAEKHPIKTVFLMAPYFGSPKTVANAMMHLGDAAGFFTFGQSNRLLNGIPFQLTRRPEHDLHPLVYKKITLGGIKCLRQFGNSILKDAKQIPVHAKLMTSACDIGAALKPITYYFDQISGQKKHIHFTEEQKVPHTMMNRREFDNGEIVDQVKHEALDLAERFNYKSTQPVRKIESKIDFWKYH